MSDISERLRDIKERIRKATQSAGRADLSVRLLAVSKMQTSNSVEEAVLAGQFEFGENYLQEGIDKIQALSHLREKIQWHLIGPLQSNKTKLAAENFDWIQSVDRLKIAQRLSEQRPANLPALNVCVQINISAEESKSGISENEAFALCETIAKLPHLALRGLMAIPQPNSGNAPLKAMHDLFINIKSQLNAQGLAPSFDTLSLGMSDDLELAIAEGSTMVRIGTAIFGSRPKSAQNTEQN
jgi:hypothetical protein